MEVLDMPQGRQAAAPREGGVDRIVVMKAICRVLYDVLHNLRFPFVFQGSGITKKSATETSSNTLYNGELTAL
jgi:hypothetical protein